MWWATQRWHCPIHTSMNHTVREGHLSVSPTKSRVDQLRHNPPRLGMSGQPAEPSRIPLYCVIHGLTDFPAGLSRIDQWSSLLEELLALGGRRALSVTHSPALYRTLLGGGVRREVWTENRSDAIVRDAIIREARPPNRISVSHIHCGLRGRR